MEKKNTLLAFFKPIKSSKAQDTDKKEDEGNEKENKVNGSTKEKKAENGDRKQKSNEKEIIDLSQHEEATPKEKRKRKANEDRDAVEPRKKVKCDKSTPPTTPVVDSGETKKKPATPSIHDFFKRVNNPKPSQPSDAGPSGSGIADSSIKESGVGKKETPLEKDADMPKVASSKKLVKVKEKAEPETVSSDVSSEGCSKDLQKNEGKISSTIFRKKGAKERIRHDSEDSDVSLDFNDEDYVNDEKDVETTPEKNNSIKDAFIRMMKKGGKAERKSSEDETPEKGIKITVEESTNTVEAVSDSTVDPEEIKFNPDVESKITEATTTPQVKDPRLMNMLSALSAVKDDIDENVAEEEMDFTPRMRKKKKKLLTPVLGSSSKANRLDNNTTTPKSVRRIKRTQRTNLHFDDKENEVDVETEDEDKVDRIYQVTCKGVTGEFHLDKFVAGGVGDCILYKGEFLTPNQFELAAGCKGRKYKATLSVNNSPLLKLLEKHGLDANTGKGAPKSGKKAASGRSTPFSESGRSTPLSESGRSTPLSGRCTPDLTRQDEKFTAVNAKTSGDKKNQAKTNSDSVLKGRAKKRARLDSGPTGAGDHQGVEAGLQHPEDSLNKEEHQEDNTDLAMSSRRSGRIARNQDKFEEKKREQEKIEKELKEMERKEDERKKKGRLVFPKQDVVLAASPAGSGLQPQVSSPRPAGRRRKSDQTAAHQVVEIDSSSSSSEESEVESGEESKPVKKKQPAKLASIFVQKKKVVEDPEKVAARRAFLMSSAPDQCRNQMLQSNGAADISSSATANTNMFVFPQVSHVQQTDSDPFWSLKLTCDKFKLATHSQLKVNIPELSGEFVKKSCEPTTHQAEINKLNQNQIRSCVGSLKSRGGLPVNRMFRTVLQSKLLSDSKEFKTKDESDIKKPLKKRKRRSVEMEFSMEYRNDLVSREAWTHKYRPRCAEDMVVNRQETERLRDWLTTWTRNRQDRGSQSSSATSDSEYDDSELTGGCALLTGPPGGGKSAAVYALAEELGMHVLEVNASSCRTGKQVTSMLLEATQSQQVSRGSASQQLNKLNFFKPVASTASMTPTTTNSAEKQKEKSRKALILFEDVDVVFEDLDTGFYGAVSKICSATKRPVVFTSSDNRALDIVNKNIKCRFQHFRFCEAINPRLVSVNLHLICLAEGFNISLSSLETLVTSRQSVRQSILHTQYLVLGKHLQEITDEDRETIGSNKKMSSKLGHDDSADEDESLYRKYLDNSSSKSRGSHRIVEYSLVESKTVDYCHDQVISKLIYRFQPRQPERRALFPLEGDEDLKSVPGMSPLLARSVGSINPNPDLYDTEADVEAEQDKMEVDQCSTTATRVPVKVDRKVSKKTREEMKHVLDHLDTVSCSDLLQHSQLQEINEFIRQKSEEKCSQKLELELDSEETCPAVSDKTGREGGMSDFEEDILSYVLPTQALTSRGLLDKLSGTRNILRTEECRRLLCREGKRGARFYHYLAKFGFNPPSATISAVCNTLI